ncbi:MAG TPA: pseudouridine synthase [Candidatus Mcinerneyibacteriales bacterium]|jgi:23S rRNA-/tRNA-specific pseudouridylate synthase|nr:pseudouridine synthase [Candidatus Mcinerneyibacteriales bacterium]HPJ69860.1 pseudouridine synthase [Candidatus Mcinerneyibacteriales bacterium]
MKRYFIKLKAGQKASLLQVIMKYLKMEKEEALSLIIGGSVWNADSNQRLADPEYLVTEETLKVNKPLRPARPYELPERYVVYEDSSLMAVFKEAGLASHPTPYSQVECLTYGVQTYLDKSSPGAGYRVSGINRLDRPTRGLMLLAKNKACEAALHGLFREKKISKIYLAYTEVLESPPLSLSIEDTLEWNGKTKRAETRVRYLGRSSGRDYFLAFPRTGRTHQVRQHFARYIAPLWGDSRYGAAGGGPLGLICISYRFFHPGTGERIRITLPERLWREGENGDKTR